MALKKADEILESTHRIRTETKPTSELKTQNPPPQIKIPAQK
jgi:hypothetical protein